MHNLLYFLDNFLNDDFRNNSFDYLRNFDYFFNNSWNYNYFLDNLFNFYYLRNLNHFLYDLLNKNFHFFDSVNMSQNLNNLFLNVFNWFGNFNVVIHDLLNFNYLCLTHDDRVSDLYDHRNLSFNDLNNWFFNNLLNFDNSFMNYRYLHYPFNFFRYLLDNLHNFSDYLFNFFDFINNNNLFNDNLNFFKNFNSVGYRHYLLKDLRNLDNSFLSLDYHNRFLNDSVDNLMSDLNVIFYLFGSHNLNFLHNFLNNLLHFNNFRYFDNLFNDLFHINRYLYYLFDDFLNSYDFFLENLDLPDFNLNMIDNFTDCNRSINLHYPLNYLLDGL